MNNIHNRNLRSDISINPIGVRDNYYRNGPTPAHTIQRRPVNIPENVYQNVQSNNNMKYPKNFNSISEPFYTKNDYETPQLLQNNVKQGVMSEIIKEYTLIIDGADRDVEVYNDPLDFLVTFNPVSGGTQPYINRDFKNVRFVKLDKILVPNKYKLNRSVVTTLILNSIDFTSGGGTGVEDVLVPPINEDDIVQVSDGVNNTNIVIIINNVPTSGVQVYEWFFQNEEGSVMYRSENNLGVWTHYKYEFADDLSLQRFIHLNIKELNDNFDFSTDVRTSDSFAIIYPDGVKSNGTLHFEHHDEKYTFNFSNLGNLNRMSINFSDEGGSQITSSLDLFNFNRGPDDDGSLLNFNDKNNIFNGPTLKYKSASKYMRHPLYLKQQCHLIFKIGVIENEIDNILF